MADRRYKNGNWQGNPQSRQERLADKLQLPAAWGWRLTYEQVDGYPVWEKDEMRMITRNFRIGNKILF